MAPGMKRALVVVAASVGLVACTPPTAAEPPDTDGATSADGGPSTGPDPSTTGGPGSATTTTASLTDDTGPDTGSATDTTTGVGTDGSSSSGSGTDAGTTTATSTGASTGSGTGSGTTTFATAGDTDTGFVSTDSGDTDTGFATDSSDTDTGVASTDSGDTGTGSGSDGGSTTGTDPAPPRGCAADCAAGCTQTLLAPLVGHTDLVHSAVARAALDDADRLVVWSAAGPQIVSTHEGVVQAELAGDVVAYESAETVYVESAFDGSVQGTIDVVGASWGLSRDGTYVWVADDASIRVHAITGALSWEVAGNYAAARVLPTATAVHVYAPAGGAFVEHIDVATAAVLALPFDGTFDGWFHDHPSFWSLEGDAFRLYDDAGVQIAFDFGDPSHGYGGWIVFGGSSVSIASTSDVGTTVETVPDAVVDGAAIMGKELGGDTLLVDLQAALPTAQVVTPPCCVSDVTSWSFAYADGMWLVGGIAGEVGDDIGQMLTPGELVGTAGSEAGRLAVWTSLDQTLVWDVDLACELTDHGAFDRPSTDALVSADGTVLLSLQRLGMGGFNPPVLRLYDLPAGTPGDLLQTGLSTSSHVGAAISANGNLIAGQTTNTGTSSTTVHAMPGWVQWASGNWALTPAVSPDGTHAVRNDAGAQVLNATYEGSLSYVITPALQDVFPGVTHGFLDDQTLLVAHYMWVAGPVVCWQPGECDVLTGVEVTDLSGNVIATSPIPDPIGFVRVSSTEVFLPSPPAIYDVYSGALLWSGAPGPAAPVGPDHVAHTVGSDLVLTKWR